MIELYTFPTPNGHKISILLEELAVPYHIVPINIARGDQHTQEFLAISPSNKIPAIVDTEPDDGGPPLSVFESGAILAYLADKHGRFLPRAARARSEVMEWLMWQIAGLGPMCGQAHHFRRFAEEKIEYAIQRYTDEAARLYRVLDRRLAGRDFIAGELSIADIACFPWISFHEMQGQDLTDFPHLKRWHEALAARPAFQRGLEAGALEWGNEPIDEEARRHLFGRHQGA